MAVMLKCRLTLLTPAREMLLVPVLVVLVLVLSSTPRVLQLPSTSDVWDDYEKIFKV